MLPNFLIIGAQKAATSFVQTSLMSHPQVFMVAGEVRYFENPEYGSTPQNVFESLFDNACGASAIGIKRPDYLPRPECAPNIHRHVPHAKLIAILRNPVDRAVSAYFHQMRLGFIPVRPLEEGLARIIAGEYESSHPKSAEILEYGFYHCQLLRYLEYFPREQLLVLRYEDIRKRPVESSREILQFLELEEGVTLEMPRSRSRRNLGVYSLSRLRLLQIRNRMTFKYNANRTKIDFDWRPGGLRRVAGKSAEVVDRILLSRIFGAVKPKLSEDMRRLLARCYDEDIRGLESLLDWDLSSWRSRSRSG